MHAIFFTQDQSLYKLVFFTKVHEHSALVFNKITTVSDGQDKQVNPKSQEST
jgi:hypothetical protein